uniref:Uncharacterized protein n=1 Tax=Anguilla anguilla TaxID=7936 RepID=A0A0E9PEI9_ANGAN
MKLYSFVRKKGKKSHMKAQKKFCCHHTAKKKRREERKGGRVSLSFSPSL